EVGERYADGLATVEEVDSARSAALAALREARAAGHDPATWGSEPAARAALKCAEPTLDNAAVIAARDVAWAAVWEADAAGGAALGARQCALLRELFGNPFRPVAAERAWLAWEGGTVVGLARAIYDERAFERLPILADALEEAGCTDERMLGHCRSGGEHVRG